MIIGVILTFICFGFVAYQVWVIEHNKAEILSLYALLTMPEINLVYVWCDRFMQKLNTGSIIGLISQDEEDQFQNEGEAEEVNDDVLSQQTSIYGANGRRNIG